MIDYIQSLREGIIEAYVGIVTALKAGGKGKRSPRQFECRCR